jgi:branched-chain amino acid transport system permease protein
MLAQQLINGLVLGSIYALSALGFTLIFGVARVVNFAYGEFLMLGAFLTLTTMTVTSVDFFIALPLSMGMTALLSVAAYLLAIRPVMRGTDLQALLVTTGMLYVLREVAILVWGTAPRQMETGLDGALEIGDIIVTHQRLLAMAFLLIMVTGLYALLYKARIGRALRAVAQNRFGAETIGLNVDRVISFAFAVSGAMACVAGSLIGALYATEPSMGGAPLLKAFVIVIFGGLGSVPGAIVGGLVIGLTETLVGAYISNAFKDVFTFLIMLGVLLWRPTGLLGVRST